MTEKQIRRKIETAENRIQKLRDQLSLARTDLNTLRMNLREVRKTSSKVWKNPVSLESRMETFNTPA